MMLDALHWTSKELQNKKHAVEISKYLNFCLNEHSLRKKNHFMHRDEEEKEKLVTISDEQ